MFINFSNHPSSRWDKTQTEAAEIYGQIVDVPFPAVPADADEIYVDKMAERSAQEILTKGTNVARVMVQGEFSLVYRVVNLLKKNGLTVVTACAERNVIERNGDDGELIKEVRFNFIRFREY